MTPKSKTSPVLNNMDNKYTQLMEDCKILYHQYHLPMTQTCMCFGFECGEGWYEPLQKLSYQLESINYIIKEKYRIAIEATQVKSKYGCLRFYYSVAEKPKFWRKALAAPFTWLSITSIDASGFEKMISDKLADFFYSISDRILGGSAKKQHQRAIVMSAIDFTVNNLINKCISECYNVCEECGKSLGYTPRCVTEDWVSIICPSCAEKLGRNYRYEFKDNERKTFKSFVNDGSKTCKEFLDLEGKLLDCHGKLVDENSDSKNGNKDILDTPSKNIKTKTKKFSGSDKKSTSKKSKSTKSKKQLLLEKTDNSKDSKDSNDI